MKSDFDKEIDSLLRWSARRGAAPSIKSDEEQAAPAQASAHLDIDELNAYAENALLAVTRTRYAAHLADCDRCRKIATDIALAANIAGELKERPTISKEAAPIRSWRSWVAALFAPSFLRYAVPALALLVVGVIALVVTRTRPTETFVAQREESAQVRTAVTKEAQISEQTAQTPLPATASEAKPPHPTAAEGKSIATEATVQNQSPARSRAEELVSPTPLTTATNAAPASAPEPPPPPKASETRQTAPQPELTSQAASDAETAKIESARKDEDRPAETNKENTQTAGSRAQPAPVKREMEEARVATRDTMSESTGSGVVAASQPTKAKKAPAQGAAPIARRRAIVSAEEKSDAPTTSSETRSISGRRFRRQGGAWVDTSYHSSQATVNIARGSEQYRALIADEPELRRIAEQLGGEVIVVWKGRAYRIH